MESFADLPAKLLSQCGLISMLLAAAIIWLAIQNAKTREGWEKDRASMLDVLSKQNAAYEKVVTSNAKLEGIVLAVQNTAAGRR